MDDPTEAADHFREEIDEDCRSRSAKTMSARFTPRFPGVIDAIEHFNAADEPRTEATSAAVESTRRGREGAISLRKVDFAEGRLR